jgi:hypothetical protein
MRMKRFERSSKRVASQSSLSTKKLTRKENDEFRLPRMTRAMRGEGEDIEVVLDRGEVDRDRDQDREEVDRGAVTEIGRRDDTGREVLRIGKTESVTQVMGRTVIGRKGSRLRSSGGGRRRRGELNTKVSSKGWEKALIDKSSG